MRLLTQKFTSYAMDHIERKTGKTVFELLDDLGNLSVSTMIILIQTGNFSKSKQPFSAEDASDRLDNFLEEHTLIDAMLQLMEEIDMDTGIIRAAGQSVKKMREELTKKISEAVDTATDNIETSNEAVDNAEDNIETSNIVEIMKKKTKELEDDIEALNAFDEKNIEMSTIFESKNKVDINGDVTNF